MIEALVAGRLHGDPVQRIDKAGKAFSVARLRASAAEGDTFLVNVIAFDAAVRTALHRLRDGDALALAGSVTPKVWLDKQGNPRPALDMVAHRVLSADAPEGAQMAPRQRASD